MKEGSIFGYISQIRPGIPFLEVSSQIIEMSEEDVKCELCGRIFVTHKEKELHKKLEHKNHHGP